MKRKAALQRGYVGMERRAREHRLQHWKEKVRRRIGAVGVRDDAGRRTMDPNAKGYEESLEPLASRLWRQVAHGIDKERLLPPAERRRKDLAKKLDRPLERNGWRIYVAGCAYTLAHGKAPQRRNAEVALVETVGRWHALVAELLPDRVADLRRIVEAGLERPEAPPKSG